MRLSSVSVAYARLNTWQMLSKCLLCLNIQSQLQRGIFKYSQASKKKKHDLGKLEYIHFFRYIGQIYTLNIVHSNCVACFEI